MSNQQDSGSGFRIRPLNKTSPTEPAAKVAPPTPTPQATPAKQNGTSAGLFKSAQSALAFLGAVAGAGLATEAHARRGPANRWWIETPVPWLHAFTLTINAGGRAFAGSDRHWVEGPADGSQPAQPSTADPGQNILLQTRHDQERLPLTDWPEAGLADLLMSTQLRRAKLRLQGQVVVLAPAVLARTILQRAVELGLDVQVAAAQREPLAGGNTAGVSWLRIRWEKTHAPESFLHSISRLPFVAVARPVDIAHADDATNATLLIDIRYAAPLSSSLVAAMVPASEQWLLGGPEVGHWRIQKIGQPVDAAEMVTLPPAPDAAFLTPALPEGNHHAAIELCLTRRAPLPGYPDAVLLDDAELAWLRDYLVGKPVAETAYLLLGPGRHLLLAPGGVLATLPFGLTLRRIGPGGIHLQEGHALFPPLPEAARRRAFPCGEGEILTLTSGNTASGLEVVRFCMDELTPVWALWLGEPVPVAMEVTGDLASGIHKIVAMLKPPEPGKVRQMAAKVIPALRQKPATDRDQLLREAIALEQQGRLAEAAQNMEKAGELAAAGRLYEMAAQRGR